MKAFAKRFIDGRIAVHICWRWGRRLACAIITAIGTARQCNESLIAGFELIAVTGRGVYHWITGFVGGHRVARAIGAAIGAGR